MENVLLAYLRLSELSAPGADWQAQLPRDYRIRLEGMRSASARRQTLAGLRLLEVAAGADLGALELDADGRPMLPGGPFFSISHSGDYCICAVATAGRVGVDIERERRIELRRLGRLLSPAERAAAERDYRAFFRAWTAREATVKATGRVGLRRVSRVRIDDRAGTAVLDERRWYLQRPHIAAGYAACLASEQPLPAATVYNPSESAAKNSAA